MSVFINPGSGPVDGGIERLARANMYVLIADACVIPATFERTRYVDLYEVKRRAQKIVDDPGIPDSLDDLAAALNGVPQEPEGWRWSYTIVLGDRTCEVEMPGLSIERVRYMRQPDQDIWDFPRLYVEGSSWVWCFATSCVRDILLGEDDDECD